MRHSVDNAAPADLARRLSRFIKSIRRGPLHLNSCVICLSLGDSDKRFLGTIWIVKQDSLESKTVILKPALRSLPSRRVFDLVEVVDVKTGRIESVVPPTSLSEGSLSRGVIVLRRIRSDKLLTSLI